MREERYGWRAKIGIVSPGGFTIRREWDSVLPEGVISHHTIMEHTETTPEGLRELKKKAVIEAKKLRGMDILLFACTSGSFIGGPGYDQQIIKDMEAASGVPSTTTTTCVLTAITDLKVKKMALVGPYIQEVLDTEMQFFKHYGIETAFSKGLGYTSAEDYRKLSEEPYALYRLAKEAYRSAPDIDIIFITCMASPTLKIMDTLEQETGKPVISSCSASLYGVLKQLGIKDPVEHYGQFLKMPR